MSGVIPPIFASSIILLPATVVAGSPPVKACAG
jgi:preprotein translocase subunit SecY